MIVCVQIEQQNIITGWEGGRRPCEQGLKGKGGREEDLGVRLPSREQESAKRRRYRLRG